MIIQAEDPGTGVKFSGQTGRLINPDGAFNVKRTGLRLKNINLYYYLINLPWLKFIGFVFLSYIGMNIIFASLYFLNGIENLTGAHTESDVETLLDVFFFSVHTITTIGYGNIIPKGIIANSIVTIESITGVLGFALATGLLYGRFSRATAKIQFSKHALIAPYKDITSLQFRVANQRSNELMEIEAQVLMSVIDKKDGQFARRYYTLRLERSTVMFFPLTWTVVHPIDTDSPLYGKTYNDLVFSEVEIMILLKGFDDTFSQVVNSRNSYLYNEIIWDARFLPAFKNDNDGKTNLQLDKISDYELINK